VWLSIDQLRARLSIVLTGIGDKDNKYKIKVYMRIYIYIL